MMYAMLVVTSGIKYADIDTYACCVAYAELLNLLGRPAIAASSAPLNESIPRSLRALRVPFASDYSPARDDQFVLVDVSDPAHLDEMVDLDRVVEVIDHHPHFDKYWQPRIGEGSRIEFIGAAATLVYERWAEENKLEHMRRESAELLAAAILDNTLNFGAQVTTQRDKQAYNFLHQHAGLSDKWATDYFAECQQSIEADPAKALTNDTKFMKFTDLDEELCLGQLVIWEGKKIIDNELEALAESLGSMSKTWLANVVSIAEQRSFFVTNNSAVKQWVERTLQVKFDGLVAPAHRLWLRKEIIKEALT